MSKLTSQPDSVVWKIFGNKYRTLRLERGMIQEDVAEYGFSVRHYQQLEAGRPHTLETLFKIAVMFGITASELVVGVFE